ncbi:GreA/GreB family elongation factor [Patescibacteria group bacterium]|nr:GreA/GreB family elongation factor [Patescibacteria group bacterium]
MTETKYYVTKQGLQKIEKDYQNLLEFKKKKTTGEGVPSIWHSEEVNPDYLAFQEDMSLLETKLTELEVILKNIEIITVPKGEERNLVGLGATITVDLGGEIDEFTIVGTLEADPLQKKISNESPLGGGLLGAEVGDVVKVKTTLVNHDCKILKIVYR